MSGLTASLARFFTSSTRRSKRRRVSREYSVPLLASFEALRKRFTSSWDRYEVDVVEPTRRKTLPVLTEALGAGFDGAGVAGGAGRLCDLCFGSRCCGQRHGDCHLPLVELAL
jgi:hypothetical protein